MDDLAVERTWSIGACSRKRKGWETTKVREVARPQRDESDVLTRTRGLSQESALGHRPRRSQRDLRVASKTHRDVTKGLPRADRRRKRSEGDLSNENGRGSDDLGRARHRDL